MKTYTRGNVTLQECKYMPDVVCISLGEDLEDPETDVIGRLHKDYLPELIAAIKYMQELT